MGKIIGFLIGALTSLLVLLPMGKDKIRMTDGPGQALPKHSEEDETPGSFDQLETIRVAGKDYRFVLIQTADPSRLHFFSNFLDKRAAQNLKEAKQCQTLVNGGFYSEDFKPLGWLVVEGNQVSAPIQSQLLDGFFSIDQAGKVEIGWQRPESSVRIGLQSGPMLVWQGQPLPLEIKDDQSRRRIVLGLTSNEEVVFLAVIGETLLAGGPNLADLPAVVAAISDQRGLALEHALNLDGGSASAFLTEEIQLDEVTFIGSYFCVQ